MSTSRWGFTLSYWWCGKQLGDISTLHMVSLFTCTTSLVTRLRCQFAFAFADFILPLHRTTMWGWSCPSLNANTAWIACYWDISITYYLQYCSLPWEFLLPSPLQRVQNCSSKQIRTEVPPSATQCTRVTSLALPGCIIDHTRITTQFACRNRLRQTLASLMCSRLAWSKPDAAQRRESTCVACV